MAIQASDIVTVLTGGSNNSNPYESIGGNPSNIPIMGNLNNLFDNISETEATSGYSDYRCIYIFNQSSSDSIYDLVVYYDLNTMAESTIQLGITNVSEVQNLTISGAIASGSFTISYLPPTQNTVVQQTVEYNFDPVVWASNLETALNAIPTFSGVSVSPRGTYSARVFSIAFSDDRSYDLIGLDTSGLVSSGPTITGSVSKVVQGAPINSIPTLLDAATTPPAGVTFSSPSVSNPISIGTLYPEEGFPLWIQRTVPIGAAPLAGDGFVLQISGSPI